MPRFLGQNFGVVPWISIYTNKRMLGRIEENTVTSEFQMMTTETGFSLTSGVNEI